MSKKTKKQPAKRLKKKSKKRLPISSLRLKRLAYEHENLAAADAAANIRWPLASCIERHSQLKDAWQRGRLLRNIEKLAGVVETVSEAARKLGLPNGEALRELIDTDAEVGDIWNSVRLNTKINARKALLDAAAEGNQAAIRAVENYLHDDRREAVGSADLHKLMQKQIAELFEVTRVTVKDWTDRHSCPRNGDGSYDLYSVIRWWQGYIKRKGGAKIESTDKLRDLKAEEKMLDLAQRRGELLERDTVIAGLVARVQATVAAFGYKRRELASMCHGQTIEGIEDILGRFFEDLQRKQLELPEFMEIKTEAREKLLECLQILATEATEKDDSSNRKKPSTKGA